MKNQDDGLNKFETVTTILVNIGTIVSWIITLVTALTLIAQPQPIAIPGVFELGKAYIIIFLISILFGYIQLLRHFWHRSRFTKSDAESSFSSYLYTSIAKFKRPFVLVGFAIILVALIQVEPIGSGIVLLLTLIVAGATIQTINEDSPLKLKKFFWKLDDEFRKRWLKRIKKQLYEGGCTNTVDYLKLATEFDEINWAIKLYFDLYEFEQSLVFNQHFVEEDHATYEICEIRFKHVRSRLPD